MPSGRHLRHVLRNATRSLPLIVTLNASEAILTLADGRLLSLRKVYTEVRTKKRGSASTEFTGHTTNHFIDGVPVPKGEYDQKVASIMDEGAFRLLTDPRHFNEFQSSAPPKRGCNGPTKVPRRGRLLGDPLREASQEADLH